jgi:hypothetical protein
MGALVACRDCGFVTRRHSHIGLTGVCPDCRQSLMPISFSAARALQIRKSELMLTATRPPLGSSLERDPR